MNIVNSLLFSRNCVSSTKYESLSRPNSGLLLALCFFLFCSNFVVSCCYLGESLLGICAAPLMECCILVGLGVKMLTSLSIKGNFLFCFCRILELGSDSLVLEQLSETVNNNFFFVSLFFG